VKIEICNYFLLPYSNIFYNSFYYISLFCKKKDIYIFTKYKFHIDPQIFYKIPTLIPNKKQKDEREEKKKYIFILK
jgi:hypothetical protein